MTLKMKTKNAINNRIALQERLAELREERSQLEQNIIKSSAETYRIITNPAPIIKHAVADLAKDKQFKSDVLQIALHTAANYLGKKIAQSDLFSSFTQANENRQQKEEQHAHKEETHNTKEPSVLRELFAVIKNRYAKDL